jgi:nucleoside 2-deoxyribosyltransferase
MNIFLATSFSSKVDAHGAVLSEFKRQLERLITLCEAEGFSVFCAARQDGWRLNDVDPVDAFNKDIQALDKADAVIALVGNNPPSAGVRLELGYALAKGKRMLCLYDAKERFPYVDIGLAAQPSVTKAVYHNFDDIIRDTNSYIQLLKAGEAKLNRS